MPKGRTAVASVALSLAVVTILVSLFARVVNALSTPVTADDVVWTLGYLSFAAVGAVVFVKRPGHPIGWMYLALGLLGAVYEAALGVATLQASADGEVGAVAGWVSVWTWAPSLGLVVWSVVVFPTGRGMNRGLAILGATTFGATVCLALAAAVEFWPIRSAQLAVLDEALEGMITTTLVMTVFPFVLLAAVVAMIALVVRFRRSVGVERQQIKWAAAVALLAAPAIVLSETVVPDGVLSTMLDVVSAPMWFAVAVGLAILRYRLYDIDRIISRTVSYALVTAILVGVYAAGVLGFGAVARGVAGDVGELVVALSTLVAAALFSPVRRRVQAAVDRRFNRARFDAMQAAEDFGRRLREHVELEAVTDELHDVVATTLQPLSVGLVTTRGSHR